MTKHVKNVTDEGKVWPQVMTILIVCLSSVTSGIFFAWTSPFVVKLTKDKVNYSISDYQASFLVYIPSLAIIFFSIPASKLNDILGRKKCLLLMAVPHLISWIITAVAKSVYVFYAARVISGMADAMHFSTVPIYIAEISVPKVRGSWGNVVAFHSLGQFLVNLVGLSFTVQQTSYILITLPILFVILVPFLPETPYYSIMTNREEDAKNALRFFRRKPDVEDEFLQIKQAVERQMSEKGKWKDLITIESNRKAVFAAVFLRVSQQLSGLGAFQSYTHFIFEKSGSGISSSDSTLICAITFAVLSLSFGYIGERLGRRRSYLTAMTGCSIAILSEGIYFYLDKYSDVDVSSLNWFPLAGMLTYLIFAGTFGLLSIPTLMSGELFPSNVKTNAFGVQVILLGTMLIVASVIFYNLNEWLGLTGPFLFFGSCSVVSAILSIFLVPETKGKTLEEIQTSLMKGRAA